MKIAIIDDEQEARELLEKILNKYIDDIQIVGMADSVEQGVELINNNEINLLLLDVELTDGTGFDILTQLNNINFEVIFVTGYDKYALNAIKFNCLDYILKPIDITEVKEAVEKARLKIEDKFFKKRISNLLNNLNNKNTNNNKIALPTSKGLEFVKINDIIKLESDQSYTWIYLINNNKILTTKYLKEYENILEGYPFFRVHRAFIVNINHIVKYEKEDGGQVVMSDGSIVLISRRKKESFLKKIRIHL